MPERLHAALAERDTIAGKYDVLAQEIAAERRRPWRQLGRYFEFKLLKLLSRSSPPLSARAAERFLRSAIRKDPNRSVAGREMQETGLEGQPKDQGWIKYSGSQRLDSAKQNILVVSHDASRSGAPILALNLIQSLSARYNVTALVLRGGDILDSFREASASVLVGDGLGTGSFGRRIAATCRETRFAFAVVNSVESRAVLKHLQAEGVPTVSLLHEFASYVEANSRGASAFVEIFEHSTEVVFSTRLTLEAAQEQCPRIDMSKAHVLAQGKCVVPKAKTSTGRADAEAALLQTALRPHGRDDKRVVVIGAGTVSLRKGVDLFIEVATRVIKTVGAENAAFFWIGPRYDPDKDLAYSAYLRDQMKRAGVEQHMTMMRETSEIELAYSLADIFLLPSRLDPLPNVTIDALSVGLPVVCFENASGIADLLVDAGLKQTCVANYIDTRDMADKVLALATDPELRAKVAQQSRTFAAATFDNDVYARKIESLGQAARVAKEPYTSVLA